MSRRPRGCRRARFVRYSSPFGTPERLTLEVAERRLAADRVWWERELEIGTLTPRQIEHGPPRIERLPTTTK